LDTVRSGLKHDVFYIAQHLSEYTCTSEGPEQIGEVKTEKLKINGPGLVGQKKDAQIRLRGISGTAKVLYPSEAPGPTLHVNEHGPATLAVPLQRIAGS
jgi:hypothetical protein